jgi:hypothetical protein
VRFNFRFWVLSSFLQKVIAFKLEFHSSFWGLS